MMGDKTIESISIDEDAFDKENKEMVEDLLALALNELYAQVEEAESKIEQKITGKAGGFGF
jgi:DNA-binding protein YbaB